MSLRYRIIPELALCSWPPAEPLPATLMELLAATGDIFVHVMRSPGEVTIICPASLTRAVGSVPGFRVHAGYVALQLQGPFPLDAIGILHAFLSPLASAGIPIFALSSYLTDFVLIEGSKLATAQAALLQAGYHLVD